jgi:hypothetical protein
MQDFIKYITPREGLFLMTTSDYKPGIGWAKHVEKKMIIGEDSTCYIERFQKFGYGEWEGDSVIQKNDLIGIGPHKTRLVRWLNSQLSLFDN